MTNNEQYIELEKRLLAIFDDESKDEEAETLREQMTDLWWEMTDEEQAAANARAKAWNDARKKYPSIRSVWP